MRASLRPHWPVWLAAAAGLGGLWWRGGALVLDGQPTGFQWPSYLFGAWNWRHGRTDLLDPFREPLHAVLVGIAGESIGYADAALLLAGLCMGLVLLSATAAATGLGGRWAGVTTALTVPLSPIAASGARWATGYPLVTAGLSASIAAAVFVARTGRVGWLVVWAAATAMAVAADVRGLIALAMVPLLWSGRGGPRSTRGHLVRGTAIVAAVGVGLGLSRLGPDAALSWRAKRAIQTRVVERWTTDTTDRALAAACADVPRDALLTPRFLTTPCAAGVLRHNQTHALPGMTAWPAVLVLAALGLGLVRRTTGPWRTYAACTATAIGCAAAFTPFPARYQLLFTGWLAPLVPVALVGLVPRSRRAWSPAVALLASLVVLWADPHRVDDHPVQGIDARWRQPGRRARALRPFLEPQDIVRDCAGSFVELALAPDHLPPAGPTLTEDGGSPCLRWLSAVPGGRAHVLVLPSGGVDAHPLTARVTAHPGWEPLPIDPAELGGFTAWRRGPVD